MSAPPAQVAAVAAVEARLLRLVRRAERVQLIVGTVLLVLVVGVLFYGFAAYIEWRWRQLRRALHARPPRVASVRLHTRRTGPMGITAVTTVFAVIGFALEDGRPRALHLQGRAADLAQLVTLLEAAIPDLRVDDPETVQAIVV